jgi:MerR family copper efflux transcriptional regulator
MEAMNIGQAAGASGVSPKMIRYYEQVGLFPQPQRTDSGYRQYAEREVHTLRFIRHERDLGFSIAQIGELVGLWQNRRRSSRQVKALAEAHIIELQRKVQELLAMKATLEHLVRCCHGDDRPDCPILDELANPGAAVPAPTSGQERANQRSVGLRVGKSTKGSRRSG